VVVTGAASGMGEQVARILHELGANVTALDLKPVSTPVKTSLTLDLLDQASIDGVVGQLDGPIDSVFSCAGLPGPQMLLSARVEGGPDSFAYEYLAEVMRTLLPLAERFGIASADAVGIDTLAARLRDEIVALDGVMQPPAFIGAWTRVA